MALYIDPPQWPAHGTLFSHLISDRSLVELHSAAAALGLPLQAFDEDHYDVPTRQYDAAVEVGARPVSGADLVRILRRSGLRIPAKERVSKVLPALRRRWDDAALGASHIREDLLRRWTEPHRSYHTVVHLLECLDAIDALAARVAGREPARDLLLAAWFHDAVYYGVSGEDEKQSAAFAQEALKGDLGDDVARLVLLTRDHVADHEDLPAVVLLDADLSILAAAPGRYLRYAEQVRHEYPHVDDAGWREGRAKVLSGFLGRERIYNSRWAHAQWEESARANIEHEMRHSLSA